MRNRSLFYEENLLIICQQKQFDMISKDERRSKKFLRNNACNVWAMMKVLLQNTISFVGDRNKIPETFILIFSLQEHKIV